jgi:diketogulonate reductase-like aldo/keto reductase
MEDKTMTVKSLQGRIPLNNGQSIPQVGLGVWRAQNGEETKNAVLWALDAGYRSIDTASLYANEESVGDALKESGILREEVFVTTKVWNNEQGYEKTLAAFERSRKKLQLDYVDLYLSHFPVTGLYQETWRAMEKLVDEGLIRSIGVSNFHAHHVDALLSGCRINPVINQIERHPYLTQKNMLEYNAAHNILTECWAPIAKGKVLDETIITKLAKKYEKTPAQIVLRWHLEQGVIIIPKSVHKERILENADIFDFSLTEAEVHQIDTLERGGRIGKDPDEMVYET